MNNDSFRWDHGGNSENIRDWNLDLIRHAVKREKTCSKPRLAELTGLSVVTINTLIKELCASGEILLDRSSASAGKRAAMSYKFNNLHRLAMIFCGQWISDCYKIYAAAYDLYGNILYEENMTAPDLSEPFVTGVIDRFLERLPAISVLVFGLPGIELGGRVTLVDFRELEVESLTGFYSQKYNLKVLFENDINAAVRWYAYSHAVRRDQCVVGFSFPRNQSTGSGIYVNGGIHRGKNGAAGEITYLGSKESWAKLEYSSDKLPSTLANIFLPVIAILNPDWIVLYSSWIQGTDIHAASLIIQEHFPRDIIPELRLSPDIYTQIIGGTLRLALDTLMPLVQ